MKEYYQRRMKHECDTKVSMTEKGMVEKKNEGDVKWEKGLCVFNSEGNHESGTAQVLLTYYSHITERLHKAMAKLWQSKDKARASLCPACTNRFAESCARPASLMSKVYGKSMFGRSVLALVALVVMMSIGGSSWGQSEVNQTWAKNTTITLDCSKKYVITKTNDSPSDPDAAGAMTFNAPTGCKIMATLTSRTFGTQGGGWNRKTDNLRLNNATNWTGNTPENSSYVSNGNTLTITFNNTANNNNAKSSYTIEVVCWCTNADVNFTNLGSSNIECGQTTGFFDDGGATGNYTNANSARIYTFTSDGDIKILFSMFTTAWQDADDFLGIWCDTYDADNDGYIDYDNLIAGGTTGYNYTDIPANITIGTEYTCTSGTMYVIWFTGRENNAAGWAAKVWAENCCDSWNGEFSFGEDPVEMVATTPAQNFIPTLTASPSVDYDVTYSITSGTAVTLVNASTGEISATSVGSAQVTATITPHNGSGGDYCTITKTFTVNVECGSLAITNNGRACSEMLDGICYIDTCAHPGGRIRLSPQTSIGGNLTYDWTWNSHNGGTDTVMHTRNVDISIATQRGIDVELTIHSSLGCSVTKQARIRVGGGITTIGVLQDMDLGNICVGTTGQLIIGTGGNSNIQISQPPVQISASLGHAEKTFIPDGYCEGQGICYSSIVEFTGFDANARVTSANDIEYVKINLEHSHIDDLQIKIECPDGRSAIILEDRFRTSQYSNEYSENAQDDYTYTWNNMCAGGRYCPIQFGNPNRNDDEDHRCDTNYNPSGTGDVYIWSNATTLGYQYAGGGDHRVYNNDNLENAGTYTPSDGIERTIKKVKPSIEGTPFGNVYQPRENLYDQLRTCHLNGEWKITVCDSWEGDNGYIFSWELGLADELMPNQWGFEDTVVSRTLSCEGTINTYQHGDTLFVAPVWGNTASSCHVVLTDNLGCQQSVSNTITFELDSTWVSLKDGNPNQALCKGERMSAIEYAYGDKAASWKIEWWKEGEAHTTRTSAGNLTHGVGVETPTAQSGENGRVRIVGSTGAPTDAGVYHYILKGIPCASGCEHCDTNIKEGTITVYALPTGTATSTPETCYGDNDGKITVTASGTAGSTFSYSRNGGSTWQSSNEFTGLAAGDHTITIRETHADGTQCDGSVNVTVEGPTAELSVTVNSPTICKDNTAVLTADPQGGTPGYRYSWNTTPVSATQSITTPQLSSTTQYTVTVTDSHDCTASATATVTVSNLDADISIAP